MKFALLEPLRGLAAVWVLLFHFEFSTEFQQRFPVAHAFCKLGDLAVPMFFVISGFCIAASARSSIRKHEPAGSFLMRRLKRIFPPYWASIVVVVALPFVIEGLAALKTHEFRSPDASRLSYGFLKYDITDWAEVFTLTRVFAAVPDAHKLEFKFTTINAVYWSLAIEVQFYFIAALAVRYGKQFYAVMASVTLVSLPFVLYPPAQTWGICLPFWPMFALGIGLYAAFERGWMPSRLWSHAAGFVGIASIIAALVSLITIAATNQRIAPFTFAGAFAVMMFALEGLDSRFQKFLVEGSIIFRRPAEIMVLLGTMSYSIYLLHGRMQFLAMQGVRQLVPANTLLFDALSLVITLGLCYPFFRYCERAWIATPKAQSAAPTVTPTIQEVVLPTVG